MKKTIKFSVVVTLVLAAVFAFSACGSTNYHRNVRRVWESADRVQASRLATAATVIELPGNASNHQFVGDDVMTFTVPIPEGQWWETTTTVLDLRTGANITSGRADIRIFGNRFTGLFIATQNADDEWALRNRGGALLLDYDNDYLADNWGLLRNISVLSSTVLRIGNDIWRVRGNSVANIIQGVGGHELYVSNSIIFNKSTSIVYDMEGDIVYAARSGRGTFTVLSERRGVYVQEIEMPRDTRSRDWDYSRNGYKYRQIIDVVDFSNGSLSRTSVSGRLVIEALEWAGFDPYDETTLASARNYVFGSIETVENGVLTGWGEMVVFNDRLSVRYRLGEDILMPLARNRYFEFRQGSYVLLLTDQNGNILQTFDSASFDRESGIIISWVGNMNYYSLNGVRIITRSDFDSFSGFFGGYAIVEQSITRGTGDEAEDGTGWYAINNSGTLTRRVASFPDETRNVVAHGNAGVYIVTDSDGQRIYNFTGTLVHTLAEGLLGSVRGANDGISGGRRVSGTGASYVFFTPSGGNLSVIRLA